MQEKRVGKWHAHILAEGKRDQLKLGYGSCCADYDFLDHGRSLFCPLRRRKSGIPSGIGERCAGDRENIDGDSCSVCG